MPIVILFILILIARPDFVKLFDFIKFMLILGLVFVVIKIIYEITLYVTDKELYLKRCPYVSSFKEDYCTFFDSKKNICTRDKSIDYCPHKDITYAPYKSDYVRGHWRKGKYVQGYKRKSKKK